MLYLMWIIPSFVYVSLIIHYLIYIIELKSLPLQIIWEYPPPSLQITNTIQYQITIYLVQ